MPRAVKGRAAENATAVIAAIAGTAGVGKMALAVHWAHRVREQLPDGQLHVNLRGFDPFAAEAFHWFYDDQAVAQIARVLRPRGRVVLMWNVPAGPWDPPIVPVERLLLDRMPQADFFASMGWIADLADDERLPLLDQVRSLLSENTYRRAWETDVHWTQLR